MNDDIERAKNRGYDLLAAADADLEAGRITEAAWYARIDAVITPAYLAAENPRAQSGHSGDEAQWHHARGLLVDLLSGDGTFLDVGCANGYLCESLTRWARKERGIALESHGLDIAPALATLARLRLPDLASRIHVGNALTWSPPRRYEHVRTGLEYVPRQRRRDLLRHLLDDVVAPGGRLIVGVYNEERDDLLPGLSLEAEVASWGFPIGERVERLHRDDRLRYRAFWIGRT